MRLPAGAEKRLRSRHGFLKWSLGRVSLAIVWAVPAEMHSGRARGALRCRPKGREPAQLLDLAAFPIDREGPREDNAGGGPALIGGALSFGPRARDSAAVGEVPEWLKGTDCKSVGFAYAGSNPALSTTYPSALIRH